MTVGRIIRKFPPSEEIELHFVVVDVVVVVTLANHLFKLSSKQQKRELTALKGCHTGVGERPESSVVTITWHASKYKVHKR